MTFQKKRRQGWSVLWRLFCCRFARCTLKTAWPSAWDTRQWPLTGRAGKRRRKGAGNPCRENGNSPHVDILSTWGETDVYPPVAAEEIHVVKLTTWKSRSTRERTCAYGKQLYPCMDFLPPSGGVFRLSHLGVIVGYPMQTVMRFSRCNGQNGNKKAVTKQTSSAFAFSGRSC